MKASISGNSSFSKYTTGMRYHKTTQITNSQAEKKAMLEVVVFGRERKRLSDSRRFGQGDWGGSRDMRRLVVWHRGNGEIDLGQVRQVVPRRASPPDYLTYVLLRGFGVNNIYEYPRHGGKCKFRGAESPMTNTCGTPYEVSQYGTQHAGLSMIRTVYDRTCSVLLLMYLVESTRHLPTGTTTDSTILNVNIL